MSSCSPCSDTSFVIVQGEDRNMAIRLTNEDGSPFNLTPITEIRARFRKANSTIMELRFTRNEIIVVEPLAGRLSVNFTSTVSLQLAPADRQDFVIILDKGPQASAQVGLATIEAVNPGLDGNLVTLSFDGVKTISQVVAAWNTANPEIQIIFSPSPQGTTVPVSQTVTLSGGVSGRRKVNFRKALTVERQIL
jgi:hypothetical protein